MEPTTLTPVYRESSAYAREHGELENFRLSHQANLDCKRAIQDAISRYFDGWRLDKKAALEILEQFGMERTTLVPVSYTHLDVYKRQDRRGAPRTDSSTEGIRFFAHPGGPASSLYYG